jgi:hypothetical protein
MPHILPALNQEINVVNNAGTQKGGWFCYGPEILDVIRDRMVVEDANSNFELTSIPDIWASLHVFESGLRDMDAAIIGEWRGLLTLLALSSELNLGIEIVNLNLREYPQYDFLTIASTHHPVNSLEHHDSPHNWNEIGIAHYQGSPIALIVPNVLICPARGYGRVIEAVRNNNGHVPWFNMDTQKLECPLPVFDRDEGLEFVYRQLLGAYIKSLWAEFPEAEGWTGTFKGLLNQFRDNLFPNEIPGADSLADRVNEAFNLPNQGYYQWLRTCKIIRNQQGISGYEIQTREDLPENVRAIYIDDDLPGLLNCSPRDIPLPHGISFDRYSRMSDAEKRDQERAWLNDNYLLIRARDLFTDMLYAIHGVYSMETRHHPAGFRNYYLPLKPLALYLFSPEYIRDNLTINGEAVSLTVNLSIGDAGDFKQINLIPSFENDEEDDGNREGVYAFVYPALKNAPRYYVAARRIGVSRVEPAFPLSLDIIKTVHIDNGDLDQFQGLIDDPVRFAVGGNDKSACYEFGQMDFFFRLSEYPEALAVKDTTKQCFVGLLLCPAPRDNTVNYDSSMVVGIDLGSSNTCVYWKKPGPEEEISLLFDGFGFNDPDAQSANLVPLVEGEGEVVEEALYKLSNYFIPYPADPKSPFLTLMVDRGDDIVHGNLEPLMESFIYFAAHDAKTLSEFESFKTKLHFNLKWMGGPRANHAVMDFYRQLVYHVAVKAASVGVRPENIEWRMTYPTTFTGDRRDGFMDSAMGAVTNELGIENPNVAFYPESWATAMFCREKNLTDPVQTTITIDIGGRTSDIAIWDGNEPVWHNSIEFGGQELALKYPLKINVHKVKDYAKLALADFLKGDMSVDAFLNMVLGKADNEWTDDTESNDSLRIKTKYKSMFLELVAKSLFIENSNDQVLRFEQRSFFTAIKPPLLLTFAGVLYYLARAVDHLASTDRPSLLTKKDVVICLCGQGSLPIQRVFNDEDMAKFGKLFMANSGLCGEVSFEPSKHPKHEASFGVLSYHIDQDVKKLPDPNHAPVEKMHVDGNFSEGSLFPRIEAVKSANVFAVDDELPVFKEFLDELHRIFGQDYRSDELLKKVKTPVNNSLSMYRGELLRGDIQNIDDLPPEPVFITVLKHYIELVAEKRKEKSAEKWEIHHGGKERQGRSEGR